MFLTWGLLLLTVSMCLNVWLISEASSQAQHRQTAVTLMNKTVSQVIVNSELNAAIAHLSKGAGRAYEPSYMLVNRDFLLRLREHLTSRR